MAKHASESQASSLRYGAADVARLRNGQKLANPRKDAGMVKLDDDAASAGVRLRSYWDSLVARVAICLAVLVILGFVSTCFMGASGETMHFSAAYKAYNPLQVLAALGEHIYNAFADVLPFLETHTYDWLETNMPWYWAVGQRVGDVLTVMVGGALLGMSGVLFQRALGSAAVGPGVLGSGAGTVLGVFLLVAYFGTSASNLVELRYLLCFGLGGVLTVLVLALAGRASKTGAHANTGALLLVGIGVFQVVAVVAGFFALTTFGVENFNEFFGLLFMLNVSSCAFTWAVIAFCAVACVLPVYLMRFRLNALSLDAEEARFLGQKPARLRAVALVCGTCMALAGFALVGVAGLVCLVVPFLAKLLFGSEFSRQLAGCASLGAVIALVCRLVVDVIPFAGDGLSVAVLATVLLAPLFVVVIIRSVKGVD